MPTFAPFRFAYRTYLSTVVPLIGKAFSDDGGSYRYLSDSIQQFPSSIGWRR